MEKETFNTGLDFTKKEFGEALRATRLSRGYSQRDVTTAAGLSPSYVSQVENGRRMPTLLNVYRICLSMRVSIDSVIDYIYNNRNYD